MQPLQQKRLVYLPVVVALCCLFVLLRTTHFFSTITWEDERQRNIAIEQPSVSFLRVHDSLGNTVNLAKLAKQQRKAYLIEFVYTRCRALCLALGSAFQQAQQQIVQRKLEDQLGLLSVSFDITHDNPNSLQRYLKRMHVNHDVWQVLTMADVAVLRAATEKIGLIVIDDQMGGYTHNSAFLVLTADGHLAGLFSPDDISSAITLALAQ